MRFESAALRLVSTLRPKVGQCSPDHFRSFMRSNAAGPLRKKRCSLLPGCIEIVGLSAIQEADAFVLRSADIAPHLAEEVINLRFRDWSRM